jgi:hypothetical protein
LPPHGPVVDAKRAERDEEEQPTGAAVAFDELAFIEDQAAPEEEQVVDVAEADGGVRRMPPLARPRRAPGRFREPIDA